MPTVESVSFLGATREALRVHERAQRDHRAVVVEQRLPHAHHHDVPGLSYLRGGTCAHRGRRCATPPETPLARRRAARAAELSDLVHHRRHLAQDLPRLQVALVAADPGQAERALERAAGLGRDADGPAPLLGDVDALDRRPVVQAEEVLDRAVLAVAALDHLGPAQVVGGGQLLANPLGEVRHLRDGAGAAPVEPEVDLLGAIGGLPQPGDDLTQRGAIEAEEVRFGRHGLHETILSRAPSESGPGSGPQTPSTRRV